MDLRVAERLDDTRVMRFRCKVRMERDDEADSLYPRRWIGKVRVTTTDGHCLTCRVDEPKGDPANSLTRAELEAKAIRLASFRKGATTSEMRTVMERIWAMDAHKGPTQILPA